MVELVLILYGADAVRRRWWVLGLTGLVWFTLGLYFFVDAFTGDARIYPVYFVIPLVIDGILSFLAAYGNSGAGKTVRFAKSVLFLLIAFLVVATAGRAEIIVGLLVGFSLVADVIWRMASVYIVRFSGWRRAAVLAVVEFLLGVWSFLPWPSHWQGEVGADVGLLLMFSALGVLELARRLKLLPLGAPISRAVAQGLMQSGMEPSAFEDHPDNHRFGADGFAPVQRVSVTVHVWTPTGAMASVDHAVSRYVAARDARGVISTGHAALEAADLYVSHYPAVEIDRSAADFRRTLQATHDNDVRGRFLPSYVEEAADWCESTVKVTLDGIDDAKLRRFWRNYGADATYNLTNRNCSSTVAAALDAGVEGALRPYAGSLYLLLRLLLSPELWVAAQMRQRASAMAWTPGIVLDYARALSFILRLPIRLRIRMRHGVDETSSAPETRRHTSTVSNGATSDG